MTERTISRGPRSRGVGVGSSGWDNGANRELVDAAHRRYRETRDPALKAELAEVHLGLARQVAHQFASRGEALEDLVQVACVALLKAIDRFDPGRGTCFSTFATATMRGELRRHLRDRVWGMRVPRSMQELYLAAGGAVEDLSHELRRSPTVAEISARLDRPPADVERALDAGQQYRLGSLDAGPTMLDGDEDAGYEQAEDRRLLVAALHELPERERRVYCLRFGLGLTQSEIGARLGMSQMRVSRMLARSGELIRAAVGQSRDPSDRARAVTPA